MKTASSSLLAVTALAVAFVPAAQARTAAREGTRMVVEFTATVKTTGRFVDGRNATTTSSVNRVLKGRCQVEAGAVVPYGLDGPSKEQERAMKRKDPGMAALEKEHAKCKGNQACLMALAQKAADGGFQPAAPQVEGAVQVWYPQSCGGSLSADDVFTADIKDGGNLSYAYTSTVKGTASIADRGQKGWLGVYIEHDLAAGQVLYRFSQAEPVQLDKRTVRTGYKAGTTNARVPVSLMQGMFPDRWGPVAGPLQAGSLTRAIEGGTLSVEWRLAR